MKYQMLGYFHQAKDSVGFEGPPQSLTKLLHICS